MVWPVGLTVFYPYREALSSVTVAGAVVALVAISAGAIALARRCPAVLVGWLWYAGSLVPVIGIVQVGAHAMADRFTYVPLIGVFVMAAWGVPRLAARWSWPRAVVAVPATLAVLACAVVARQQVGTWANGVSLWEHAIAVAPNDERAHANLGATFARAGQVAPAEAEYREAIRLQPSRAETHNKLEMISSPLQI